MSYKEYQPLRVSGDWKFEWNSFFEVDPTEENIVSYFAENLLYITSQHRNRAIELQWKPENDINGAYILKVINLQEEFNEATNSIILSGDWVKPHLSFSSKKRLEIIDKVEELMFSLEVYKDERIFKNRGIVNEELESLRLEFLRNPNSKELAEKLVKSNNSNLQDLLLNSKEIEKEVIVFLSENGAKKGVKNKAKQLLKSNVYR